LRSAAPDGALDIGGVLATLRRRGAAALAAHAAASDMAEVSREASVTKACIRGSQTNRYGNFLADSDALWACRGRGSTKSHTRGRARGSGIFDPPEAQEQWEAADEFSGPN